MIISFRSFNLSLFIVSCISLTGCIGYTDFHIITEPPGASIYVDDDFKGKTPFYLSLPNPVENELILKKKGYQDFHRTILTRIAPYYYNINLLPGESSLEKKERFDKRISEAYLDYSSTEEVVEILSRFFRDNT